MDIVTKYTNKHDTKPSSTGRSCKDFSYRKENEAESWLILLYRIKNQFKLSLIHSIRILLIEGLLFSTLLAESLLILWNKPPQVSPSPLAGGRAHTWDPCKFCPLALDPGIQHRNEKI